MSAFEQMNIIFFTEEKAMLIKQLNETILRIDTIDIPCLHNNITPFQEPENITMASLKASIKKEAMIHLEELYCEQNKSDIAILK